MTRKVYPQLYNTESLLTLCLCTLERWARIRCFCPAHFYSSKPTYNFICDSGSRARCAAPSPLQNMHAYPNAFAGTSPAPRVSMWYYRSTHIQNNPNAMHHAHRSKCYCSSTSVICLTSFAHICTCSYMLFYIREDSSEPELLAN